MKQLMGILSFLTNAYMIVIFIRIILTWFSGMGTGKFQDLLGRVTDPYLNWFKRFPALRAGNLDFSPIVAWLLINLLTRLALSLVRQL